MNLKRHLNNLLRRLGWEIQRVSRASTRPTMSAGIRWLSDQGIELRTVLDVGASDGRWTADCMSALPEAEYVLWEPQPVHAPALDVFAARYEPRVTVIREAVGAQTGETFFDASDPFGGALMSTEAPAAIRVPMTTIDASLSELGARGPYLLKLDTHGYEASILAGAVETLRDCNALIIEAYNHQITEEALLFWELCALLHEKGFRPIDVVDTMYRTYDGSLWQMDLIFIKSSWPGFQYRRYD